MDFKKNPSRFSQAHIGSRGATVTAYWLGKICIVETGCWDSELKEFVVRVKETHPEGSKHRNDYLKFVKQVKQLMAFDAYKPEKNQTI